MTAKVTLRQTLKTLLHLRFVNFYLQCLQYLDVLAVSEQNLSNIVFFFILKYDMTCLLDSFRYNKFN